MRRLSLVADAADATVDPGLTEAFTEVLQRVKIPAWIVDEDGVFIWVNDSFVEEFGDRRGEHYSSTVAPEHLEEVRHQFERKLDGAAVTDYEIESFAHDGRRIRAEVSAVRLDPGKFCGVVFGLAVTHEAPERGRVHARLTPRQLEVLQLLAAGASTDQIASELYLSRATVRNYVRQILRELCAHSRLEAVVKARREGLVAD